MELRGHSPNFHNPHSCVCERFIDIPTIDLPIMLQENMWADPGNIYQSRTNHASSSSSSFAITCNILSPADGHPDSTAIEVRPTVLPRSVSDPDNAGLALKGQ
jgi:hypothetical protein